MAIPFSDNLSISGKYPDITRQEYATLADLKAVKKNKMPEMYFGYCLEDRNWYAFNKQNSEDPVTGYWRVFSSGSGSSIQVTEMPTPVASLAGTILQYVGATTASYDNGYFYKCSQGTPTTVTIETVAQLKAAIAASASEVTVRLADESEVQTHCIEQSGVYYFVVEDVAYGGLDEGGVVVLANATAYETDEAVAALGIEIQQEGEWAWNAVSVSDPQSIPVSEVEALFD